MKFLLFVLLMLACAAASAPLKKHLDEKLDLSMFENIHLVKSMANVPSACKLIKSGLKTASDVVAIRNMQTSIPAGIDLSTVLVVLCPEGTDAGPDKFNFHFTRK